MRGRPSVVEGSGVAEREADIGCLGGESVCDIFVIQVFDHVQRSKSR